LCVLGAIGEGDVAEEAGVRSNRTTPTGESKGEPKSDESGKGELKRLEAGRCAVTFDGANEYSGSVEGE